MKWYKVKDNPPPEHIDILGLSRSGRFKVIQMKDGKFNTLWEIVQWAHLPTVSKDTNVADDIDRPKKG